MGDNFLKRQVRNFQKGRDRAAVEMNRPKLFERPDLIQTTYTLKPVDGHTLEPGETLLAVAPKTGDHIDLARGNRRVARSDGDAAKVLRDALREAGQPGVVQVRVSEVMALSGVAKARIVGG